MNGRKYSPLIIARKMENAEVVALLEGLMDNPEQTRYEVRGKLGFSDELAAEFFARIVFLCDGLLQLRPALTFNVNPIPAAAAAARFFAIASVLPMELQMVLCHRVVDSNKQSILSKDSEAAFKSPARILLLSMPDDSIDGIELSSLC